MAPQSVEYLVLLEIKNEVRCGWTVGPEVGAEAQARKDGDGP